jgi:(5-formylfuran-3-yl)methyl phosphate synthase
MRLLVSVRDAAEAAAALAGGADIVDAKEPAAGPLGAVTADALREIVAAVGGRRMVTAALGDAGDGAQIAQAAADAAASGAALVKIGFAGIGSVTRACELLTATIDGARGVGTIAVAYADYRVVEGLPPPAVIEAAVRAGAVGLLVDTAEKSGPGLRALVDQQTLNLWIDAAHEAGLLAAVAGQVAVADVPWLRQLSADVVGVRGAVCEGGRNGTVTAASVRSLTAALSNVELGRPPNGVRPGVRPHDPGHINLAGRMT